MPSVVAFDSKDFSLPGTKRDFFCPIGVGITIPDRDKFSNAYRQKAKELAARKGITLKRSVFDSYTVSKLLGGQDSGRSFYDELLGDLRSQISHVHIFHTEIYPKQVPKVFMYEPTRTRALDPVEFLKQNKAGYVALCGWKYSELVLEEERADMVCLDYFQAKRTHAWDALKQLHPRLYAKGDTCNPCIAMADGLLGLVDRQLKRNFYMDRERVSDTSVKHVLRDLGLKGEPVFIGQPDLKKIVPYSPDQVMSSEYIARPIHFMCPDKRPDGMTGEEHRQMVSLMPVMDKLVEMACDSDGCVKFYDASEDYLKARDGDVFGYFDERGKQMHDSLSRHIRLISVDLSK